MKPNSIDRIYWDAAHFASPSEQQAYLDQACGGDVRLRQKVEQLLAVRSQAEGFLESPAPAPVVTVAEQPMSEGSGTVIGPYKLIEHIGEGGMGMVWMAQQTEPVKRVVALKLIKAGMDSKQVIARFEAERQALALMDHANIARVLDAGATSAGRPYFIMDLVKGMPITRYCDEHHLTPRQRLELFIPVCQAIQHAHQKGIIHRDLKPSNVLVALYDGKPVPKVIDFGVAKAAGQQLTDKTLITGFGNIVGTLEYMSPEQAEINQLDIDTRSDIYSLGVLLYELLAGSPPFSRKELEKAGMLEMLRVIREQEPSKPSTKLSSSDALPTLSANRGTEPAKLMNLVRGELDWIVMKALEKDRNRRYETANGFAMDVQRYLADEAVLACPPSVGYRFRKFARRNKGSLAVAALVLFFLVLLGGGVGWTVRDRAARHAKVAGQVESILAAVDGLEREQKWPEALAAARRAGAAAAGGEADAATLEQVRARLKELEFIERLDQIRMQRATWMKGTTFDFAKEDRECAKAFRDYGVDVDELPVEVSIDRLKTRPALAIPMAAALDDWAAARRILSRVEARADVADWKPLAAVARGIDPEPLRDRIRATQGLPFSERQEERRKLVEEIDIRAHHPATIHLLTRRPIGVRPTEASLRLLRDAQHLYPGDFWFNYDLAHTLNEQNDHEGAVRFYTAAVAIRPSAVAHNNLGAILYAQKKLDDAIRHYRKAIEIDPKCALAYNNLGNALHEQKKPDEAIAHFNKAIEIDPYNAAAYNNLGIILRDFDKKVECYKKAIELDPSSDAPYFNLRTALKLELHWKYTAPIRKFSKAIEREPSFAPVSIGVGLAFHIIREQKKSEAVAWFRGVVERNPSVAEAYIQLGHLLKEHGKLDEATAVCREAIKHAAKNADACNKLGATLCDHLKDYDGAIECFRMAVNLDLKHPHAHRNLVYALTQKGWDSVNSPDPKRRDPKRALEAITEAVKLDSESSMTWQWFGWVQYRIGDWRTSIEALEKSCKLQKGGRGDSGQWIVLTLAHARLAAQGSLPDKEREHHKAEARRWFDQADKLIESWGLVGQFDSFRRTVWDFREEARELMGVKESKK